MKLEGWDLTQAVLSLVCRFLLFLLYFQFYIDPYKLLPLQRFLPRPPGEKGPPRGGGRGGQGGGRGRGGRGGRGGKFPMEENF